MQINLSTTVLLYCLLFVCRIQNKNVIEYQYFQLVEKIGIYKYNANPGIFVLPPVYKSDNISFSAISGTSSYTENVNSSNLKLDGEYLVKGFYNFDVQTEYLKKLGKKIDTSSFINGDFYGLYNKNLDFYFSAIKKAEEPTLLSNGSNTPPANQLFQQ